MEQGRIRLAVGWHERMRRITSVAINNARPDPSSLLVGRSAVDTVLLVPRLFSLCCAAQGVAARLALAAASGRSDSAAETELLDIAREAVGEHLWRLLLDWPPMLGGEAALEAFVGWRKRLLAMQSGAGRAAVAADLRAWLADLPPPNNCTDLAMDTPAQLLPWCSARDWAAAGIDEEFAQAPTLAGRPAETGALARQADVLAVATLLREGRRVAARIAARRADLDLLAAALTEPGLLAGWVDAVPVAPGVGLARVETARGLLLHLTQVKDGRVARYVIVAPTEWNFHPQGAFAGEIVGSSAPTRQEAELLARRLALSLDPCVSYEVRVEDA